MRMGWYCASAILMACLFSCECVLVERKARLNSVQFAKGLGSSNTGTIRRASVGADQDDRQRRDTGSCGFSPSDVLEVEPQELNEKAEAIQAVWVGKDEILIIASDKVLNGHSTVWRGNLKQSIGIITFKSDHEAIKIPVMPDSLQVSPAGDRSTVVVVSLNRMFLYVSRDFGKKWNRYNTPVVDFDPTEELYLSSFHPQHMVVRSQGGELHVSNSFGERWSHITSHVQLVEFTHVDKRTEYIYYSTTSPSHSFNPLYRMDITNQHTTIVDNSAYRFRVDDHYLFVSRKNFTGNKEADVKSRRLYVTNNYASDTVKFNEVQLPSLRDEQYYVVMATHESGAFIHVYQGNDKAFGNLYVSDSTGSRFTLSLSNHLYQVYSHLFGHYSVHDFYEVESMRGVYITTVVDQKLQGHVTMITFDNGGTWQRLALSNDPGCADGEVCSLHLHLRYSQMVSPFYNMSSPLGPLSIESAPMIILAHGTFGKVRNDDGKDTKVYFSSDGGYTWKDAGLPFGSYVYGIADYGNVIVIAPNSDAVEQIWFSHDRGACFVKRTVDTTGVFNLSRGLLFDPSAASLLGFLMGIEGTGRDDEWRIVTFNFASLLKRTCQPDDYNLVQEHTSNDNCLMGYRQSFNLTKTSSICYNEKLYNYHAVKKTKCPCAFYDFECDYGFIRSSLMNCSRDPGFSLSNVCPPGKTEYQESISGFRLIPGDVCSNSSSSELLKLQTLQCTGNQQNSGVRVRTYKEHRTGLTIFLGILMVITSIAASFIVLYIWLKCKQKELTRDKVYYQRLPKDEMGKFSLDNSSSDEDLITAT